MGKQKREVECPPWFPRRCYDSDEVDEEGEEDLGISEEQYPCRDPGPCDSWLVKLCIFYYKYKVFIYVTLGVLFLAGVLSGLLFRTAVESRVKTCFGPDCYDEEKPPELKGKVLAIGAPAEVLQKLHEKPPEGKPTPIPAAGYGKNRPWDDIRLPPFARPTHYKLLLHPDTETKLFRGQVEISIQLTRTTDFLVFHAADLTITSLSLYSVIPATLDRPAGKKIYADEKDLVMVPKLEQAFLQAAGTMDTKSNLTLKMSFQGKISEKLDGLYMSTYYSDKGKASKIVSTHFEPSSARLAFPCWDEPQFKARYSISVARPKGMISLSNMPIRKTEDLQFYQPGWERDDFLTTVPMSSYLVAIAVCDYLHLRTKTAKGVKIALYAPADLISQGGLALNTAMQVLTYYEEFFGVAYPLPKLDMIAIPGFAAGAMENWGLVTFRMSSLLADDALSSEWQKQIVVQTVTHELAHQWFGNLVTMRWWNDLWLNEGFASWVEVLGAQVTNPDWGVSDQFFYDKVVPGLWLDSLQSSHPVSPAKISSVEESNALFDQISYNKGPALLRMVADLIGLPSLRIGLKTYLKTYRYGNADTDDLWTCLGAYSPFGVEGMRMFMNSWVQKQGYPLIELKLEEGELIIRQRRFTNAHSPPCPGPQDAHKPDSPCSDLWFIRVACWIGGKDNVVTREGVWLNETSTSFPVSKKFKYAKCNIQGNGFYRVSYSSQLWKMLQNAVDENPSSFDPLDRASLISDSFALTWFGSSPGRVNDPMSFAQCILPRETDLTIWSTAIHEFYKLDSVLRFQQPQKLFRDFICRNIKRIYETLGWVHDGSHQDKILRQRIMELALHIEHQDAIENSIQLFRSWKVSVEDYVNNATSKDGYVKKRLPPDIRAAVYSGGVRFLGKDAFDFVFTIYKHCNNPGQRQDLLLALTKTRNIAQLQWLLQQTLHRDIIPLQEVRTLYVGIVRNPNGLFLAWRHLKQHWESLYNELPSSSLGVMVEQTLAAFNNKYDINEAENFFTGHRMDKVVSPYNQGLETAYLNVWWLETHCEDLRIWLEDHEPTTP